MVIPKPSQSFFIVTMPIFLALPFTISLTVDCVTADMVESLFTVILFSPQRSSILFATACEIVTAITPLIQS